MQPVFIVVICWLPFNQVGTMRISGKKFASFEKPQGYCLVGISREHPAFPLRRKVHSVTDVPQKQAILPDIHTSRYTDKQKDFKR